MNISVKQRKENTGSFRSLEFFQKPKYCTSTVVTSKGFFLCNVKKQPY